MTIVEMLVHMDCSGCETKIRRALQKLQGVDEVDIDMTRQKVTVTGYAEQKKVLKTVRKTGRRAVLWPYPYNGEYNQQQQQQQQPYHYHQQQPSASYQQYHAAYAGIDLFAAPSSSYNYRKHGYDDSSAHGYYQKPAYSGVVSERAGAMFSDENPHACFIM